MIRRLFTQHYPQVRLYQRNPDRNWSSERVVGLDAVVEIPMFELHLHLGGLYANLKFRPRPTLVEPESETSRLSI
jgi:hypothetical protein